MALYTQICTCHRLYNAETLSCANMPSNLSSFLFVLLSVSTFLEFCAYIYSEFCDFSDFGLTSHPCADLPVSVACLSCYSFYHIFTFTHSYPYIQKRTHALTSTCMHAAAHGHGWRKKLESMSRLGLIMVSKNNERNPPNKYPCSIFLAF